MLIHESSANLISFDQEFVLKQTIFNENLVKIILNVAALLIDKKYSK